MFEPYKPYSYEITVKDVYKRDDPEIPEGKLAVGFRPFLKGDTFLTVYGAYGVARCDGSPMRPRIILSDNHDPIAAQ